MELDNDEHRRRAQRHQQGFERKRAAARQEKGLLMVYTGPGKGKTTAAFGMGLRVLGHGGRLGVVQFIKGALDSAERGIFLQQPGCDFQVVGEGYTWNTQDKARDMATAAKGWREAQRMLDDPAFAMVILDELNVVLHYGYLDLEEVLAVFAARRPMLHVVCTGRNAPPALIELADLVSEVRAVKHPFREQGVKAQAGVEF
ncbi:MAG: cob(I)yrinic acid a,c-diamide adenosyltransferase [Methylococcaceae bacterium]|nr:MAG: cob(I)yrinic acid a,c-diamide adenosyltransferase [Methylococcaceae bacterium]